MMPTFTIPKDKVREAQTRLLCEGYVFKIMQVPGEEGVNFIFLFRERMKWAMNLIKECNPKVIEE
jgi:hypothetical protein